MKEIGRNCIFLDFYLSWQRKRTFTRSRVSIEDNAGGIPFKVLHCIYEPYFTTKKGNSGIGLYMSKMIIEKNMDGKLSVENGLDGAVFTIIF